MNIDRFDYKDFLPYYLTEEQRIGLAGALKDFSDKTNLYTSGFAGEVLQGDLWGKSPLMDFDSREIKSARILVISNSCDISPDNKRELPVYITYAPVIGLAMYAAALKKSGIDAAVIKAKLQAIREQKITSMLFLPIGHGMDEEGVALLDRTTSIPYKAFNGHAEKSKLTSLSQVGHYLLSFKLSIHFCRMHEAIARG
ncbi:MULTISPECIES: hypothetical protein [Pseudomonas]|uniref:Uncharacterized protein n=1 Tax=Pseudomonas fluorescens TaxID=294 RepID=A0A5E6QU03_PSEFL|nr:MULTISPECIES: hypothetical protein [Pseudomonas]VVM58931.1 hypothetical protein PS659_01210 [Pseudomonas fluorescens]